MQNNAQLQDMVQMIVASHVLSDEEKMMWIYNLTRVSDEQLDMMKWVLNTEKDCYRGNLPPNLSEEQMKEIGKSILELQKISTEMTQDVRKFAEKKSETEAEEEEMILLKKLEEIQK